MSERIFRLCYPIWIASGITMMLNPLVMILTSVTGGIVDSPIAGWWLGGWYHFGSVLAAVWFPCIAWAIRNGVTAP